MVLEEDAFVIRQHFGSKLSFSEQLFSILSRVFEEVTWIFSWIWSFTKSWLNPIIKKKRKEKTPPYILEVCVLIERKRDF